MKKFAIFFSTTILVIVGILVLNVLIDIALASLSIYVFDWIFDTTYFCPKYIAIVTLILFACGRVFHIKSN